MMHTFLRENDTTGAVHSPVSGTGPGGGPVQEDEAQSDGHSGASADGEGFPHRPGAVHQRGGPASSQSAGTCCSGPPMKRLYNSIKGFLLFNGDILM